MRRNAAVRACGDRRNIPKIFEALRDVPRLHGAPAGGDYFFVRRGKFKVLVPAVISAVRVDCSLYFFGIMGIVSSSLLGGSFLDTTCLPVFLYQTISTRYLPGGGPLPASTVYLPLTMSA